MSNCAYCEKSLNQVACKGRDGLLYCSSVCCEKAEIVAELIEPQRLHSRLPKPIEIKIDPVPWWVCRMHGGGHFVVQMRESPSGQLGGGAHVRGAADSYDVVYGPCSYSGAEDYRDEMSGTQS